MHTLILITHITMMVSSMALMGSALLFGVVGKKSAARVATAGQVATVIGGIGGGLLLLGAPLSFECALLTAYLLAMTALYVYGFGMGNAQNARLIRQTK